jgi:hypothetical protein
MKIRRFDTQAEAEAERDKAVERVDRAYVLAIFEFSYDAVMMACTVSPSIRITPKIMEPCLVAPFNACALPSRLQGRTPRG